MINFGLSVIFMIELGVKITAYGLRKYAQDRFNVFDAFIVITSIIELGKYPTIYIHIYIYIYILSI